LLLALRVAEVFNYELDGETNSTFIVVIPVQPAYTLRFLTSFGVKL
jgi:hypothetical protein